MSNKRFQNDLLCSRALIESLSFLLKNHLRRSSDVWRAFSRVQLNTEKKKKKKEFARIDSERKREKGARRYPVLFEIGRRRQKDRALFDFFFYPFLFFFRDSPRGRSGGMCRRYPGLVRPCQTMSQSRRRTSDNRKPTVPPRRESRRYPGDKHRSTR